MTTSANFRFLMGHDFRLETIGGQAERYFRDDPQQTGHATDAMLSRYVRDGELFLGNAAGALF